MTIMGTNPVLNPQQYPKPDPTLYPMMVTLTNANGVELHKVVFKVGDPATGNCHHGANLYTATVACGTVAAGGRDVMKHFVDDYCENARNGKTTDVKVTCGGIVIMSWGQTPIA
jgi:hypothetical protein